MTSADSQKTRALPYVELMSGHVFYTLPGQRAFASFMDPRYGDAGAGRVAYALVNDS